ncbi:ABC transporter substrate-binding protein [Paenibacillus sp. GYB003]|uniref:ABC transporter substrate-binding protein n=1 Tax=Paenibacillus sp. GYB003 TaxID=2994392 RepID=UPI002F967DFD
MNVSQKKSAQCGTVFLLLAATFALAGCGKGAGTSDAPAQQGGETPKVSTEPVTLTAAIDDVIVDAALEKLIQDELKASRPNITLNIVQPTKGNTLNDLIAAGTVPDLIFTYNGRLSSYADRELLYDMTELAKTHQIDLSRFDPQMIDDVRKFSDKGELYGIPYGTNFHALYYNKDIFDKFGVVYPKDGMSWDQLVDLAKKVTRRDGNTQYRGFDPGAGISWIYQPLGIQADDYKSGKASINNEQWKKVFELVHTFYSIPGNAPGTAAAADQFLKDKTLAMIGYTNLFSQLESAGQNGLNWDVVQYPSYPERPNIYGNASVNVITVTKTGKHKDEAMQVVRAAVSDKVQLESSKQGKVSPLKSEAIRAAFGKGLDFLQGKQLQSIFKSKPVPYPLSSPYRSKSESIASKYFKEYDSGNIDVNTALSKAEEEINKMLLEEKAKQ